MTRAVPAGRTAWIVAAGLTACVSLVPNPRYCDGLVVCADPAFPYCNAVAHECESTPGDSGVGDDQDARPDQARECQVSSDCTASTTPICAVSGRCTACVSDGECLSAGTSRCDASGACVACLPATQLQDCPSSTPVCDGTSCRACRAHRECSSAICKPNGACALATEVGYVDNSASTCVDTLHASTPATPYCQLAPAVTLSGKSWLVVAGSTTAYPTSTLVLSQTSVTLVGPGRAASPAAVLSGTTAPSLNVGTGATVTIDGFELTTTLQDAVFCSTADGSSSLTVRNCFIHGASRAGVNINNCTVTVDASLVVGNAGGGIKLASATYTVTNDIISGNGSGAATSAGVSIDNGSMGTFAFNTVTRNTVASGVGGIDCGSGASKPIGQSIVWQNTTKAGTQLGAPCLLTSVVTVAGDDNRGSMSALPPAFVSATDFHLQPGAAANLACCIDRLGAPGTANADHDVDGNPRPRGTATTPYDIGAHEAK